MIGTLAANELKRFSEADEVRTVEKGRVEFVHLGDSTIARIRLEPGWRWSEHVKPIAKTEFCEVAHCQYVISGRLRLVTSDHQEFEIGAGDVFCISTPHDAWVLGNEPFVAVDWAGMGGYAKKE